MLTPQEVAEHGFSKAHVGGYNMKEVDDFLDQVTEDYGQLYKECAAEVEKELVGVAAGAGAEADMDLEELTGSRIDFDNLKFGKDYEIE